ncbi:MAG TPA: S41 family peptidase [Opitutaceae bacterium]|nr:S41 family peptidase [Opitutaceae bacterium]
MLKRILIVLAGAACGILLATAVTRWRPAWSLWPNRDLARDTAYFRKVLDLVAQNYVHPQDADYDKLTLAALEGMLKSLDPHSEFMRAPAYRELKEEMDGRFGGIGVQVERRDGRVTVIAPIADTPGERAGIQRGDQIVKVDGESIEKLGMDGVVDRLRGRPGTKVVVTLFRPSNQQTLDVRITREIIRVESVRDPHMLGDGIGYIQLVQFSEHSGAEFKKALEQLRAQGARALVLDLRNNPGGLLDAAVDVAEPFFRPGELVVYTQGRTPDSRQDLRAGAGAADLRLPIAVLVNAGTASAAEVVTGALKDTGRAVVVGERTFGKGSVQTVFQLQNGEAMRLTTALYYTPSGISIQEKGIEPQISVPVSLDDEAKLRLQRLRRDLTDPKDFAARFGFEPIADQPLQTAIDVLKGTELFDQRARAAAGAAAR